MAATSDWWLLHSASVKPPESRKQQNRFFAQNRIWSGESARSAYALFEDFRIMM